MRVKLKLDDVSRKVRSDSQKNRIIYKFVMAPDHDLRPVAFIEEITLAIKARDEKDIEAVLGSMEMGDIMQIDTDELTFQSKMGDTPDDYEKRLKEKIARDIEKDRRANDKETKVTLKTKGGKEITTTIEDLAAAAKAVEKVRAGAK